MILILSICFTVSLVLGVTLATQQGMVWYKIRVKFEHNVFFQPLITCVWCMPSVWSLAGYFFAFLYCDAFDFTKLIFYPITICVSSVFCGTIWSLIQIIIKKSN